MSRWTVSDLIDLEFFLVQDDDVPEPRLEERDREIFLKSVQSVVLTASPASGLFRRNAMQIWLDQRRRSHERDSGDQAVLPGEVLSEVLRILWLVIAAAGIASGAGLALSMLVYDGVEPINVSVYFSVLVLLQACLVVLTLRFAFIGKYPGRLNNYSVVYPFVASLAGRMMHYALKRFPSEKQQFAEKVFGTVMARQRLYGRVMFWTLFTLMQSFGIMFNLGAIAATLIRVLTADLAFGWQSTVQVSAQAVHSLVRLLSVPWAWAIQSSIAYPSLEQIEGSRMVLKEGIYHLATGSLVSWWPFLVLAVCVYALLPRMVLCAAGTIARRFALDRVDFLFSGADRVIMRMTRPALSTAGAVQERKQGMDENEDEGGLLENVRAEKGLSSIVLVPFDLQSVYVPAELDEAVQRFLGWNVIDVLNIRGEIMTDAQVLGGLVKALSKVKTGIVMVQEAWQPPIIEMVEFMKELRHRAGPNVPIAVLLVGKPVGRTVFTSVDKSDREIWTGALARLCDPYLRLEAVEDEG